MILLSLNQPSTNPSGRQGARSGGVEKMVLNAVNSGTNSLRAFHFMLALAFSVQTGEGASKFFSDENRGLLYKMLRSNIAKNPTFSRSKSVGFLSETYVFVSFRCRILGYV